MNRIFWDEGGQIAWGMGGGVRIVRLPRAAGGRMKVLNENVDCLRSANCKLLNRITKLPVKRVPGVSFQLAKQPERGVKHTPPYSTEVRRERVELYLYSHYVFMVCFRADFAFFFLFTGKRDNLQHSVLP
jgi:hypothetical protein